MLVHFSLSYVLPFLVPTVSLYNNGFLEQLSALVQFVKQSAANYIKVFDPSVHVSSLYMSNHAFDE